MKAKKWHSTDDCWIGAADLPGEWMHVFNSPPPGRPTVVAKQQNENIPPLKEIQKCQMWLSSRALAQWEEMLEKYIETVPLQWELDQDQFDFKKVILNLFVYLYYG